MRTTGSHPRLKDVAALAGVSVKTVSNVVNDYPFVHPDTRRRVQDAVSKLGYQPNMTARNLRSGRSGMIALAVLELDAGYFSELAHHVVDAARAHNWTVLVDETGQINDRAVRERERSAASGIHGRLIDGVILSPLTLDEADLTNYRSVPLVLLGERLGSESADHVAVDNRLAAAEATTHLLALGRTRVAAIGSQPPPYGHSARLRLQGYRDALAAAGLPYAEELVVPALEWRRTAGAEAARRLLSLAQPPDAIFCFNDLLGLGALHTLQSAGIKVPEDIAVAGFDDIEASRFSWPPLTTIAPDKQGIAREAVARLTHQLGNGEEWQPREITVGYRLEVRGSSRL